MSMCRLRPRSRQPSARAGPWSGASHFSQPNRLTEDQQMRRITRKSLLATVAAAALFVSPASDLLSSNASGSASIVPVQFGTSAEAQARISVGIFFDRLHRTVAGSVTDRMATCSSRPTSATTGGPIPRDVGSSPMTMAGTGSPTSRSDGPPTIMAAGATAAPMAGTGCRAMSGLPPGSRGAPAATCRLGAARA